MFNCKPSGNCDPAKDPHGELRGQNVLTKVGTNVEELMEKFRLKDEQQLENEINQCKKVNN